MRTPASRGAPPLGDLLAGAGLSPRRAAGATTFAVREVSLPDTVAARMRLLVCGLNPSVYAAERGVGFARGSNRFWRAAVDAELTDRERDPNHALVAHGIGMTDLCKRATTRSAEVTVAEYATGLARVERLVAWLGAGAVAFVGLEGWRAAVDRNASPGWQEQRVGGAPAYVLPSTSGLNASVRLPELVAHLRCAAGGIRPRSS